MAGTDRQNALRNTSTGFKLNISTSMVLLSKVIDAIEVYVVSDVLTDIIENLILILDAFDSHKLIAI